MDQFLHYKSMAPDCLTARDTPMILWVESRISAAQRDVNVPKRSPVWKQGYYGENLPRKTHDDMGIILENI